MKRLPRFLVVLLCGLTALAADCLSDDGLRPTRAALAGEYHATAWVVSEDDSLVRDLLAEGATIDITLFESGLTSGELFVPDGEEGGGDFHADLAGTWEIEGTDITFDHDADTFLRDMTFEWTGGDVLRGETDFDDQRLEVFLTRGSPAIN